MNLSAAALPPMASAPTVGALAIGPGGAPAYERGTPVEMLYKNVCSLGRSTRACTQETLQGNLAHKKPQRPLGPPWGPRHKTFCRVLEWGGFL